MIGDATDVDQAPVAASAALIVLLLPTPGWRLGLHALAASRPPCGAAGIRDGEAVYVPTCEMQKSSMRIFLRRSRGRV